MEAMTLTAFYDTIRPILNGLPSDKYNIITDAAASLSIAAYNNGIDKGAEIWKPKTAAAITDADIIKEYEQYEADGGIMDYIDYRNSYHTKP